METSEQQASFTLRAQSWLGRAGESEAGGLNTHFVSLEVKGTFSFNCSRGISLREESNRAKVGISSIVPIMRS